MPITMASGKTNADEGIIEANEYIEITHKKMLPKLIESNLLKSI